MVIILTCNSRVRIQKLKATHLCKMQMTKQRNAKQDKLVLEFYPLEVSYDFDGNPSLFIHQGNEVLIILKVFVIEKRNKYTEGEHRKVR